MTRLFLAVLAVTALWLTVFLVMPLVGAWRRSRGTRMVTCPENGQPAAVRIDMRHAMAGAIAGCPELRLRDCSRWPEHQGCSQACRAQAEESPAS